VQVSWFDAEGLCAIRKLQLASIDDEAEFTYIKNQLIARGLQNTQVWIGGTEIGSEDNYYWSNTLEPVELPHWDETEVIDVRNR
jgi:Lectin C-type domain